MEWGTGIKIIAIVVMLVIVIVKSWREAKEDLRNHPKIK